MCVECAKSVVILLNKMEAGGAFNRLSDDEKEQERKTLGMRLREDMDCPEKESIVILGD